MRSSRPRRSFSGDFKLPYRLVQDDAETIRLKHKEIHTITEFNEIFDNPKTKYRIKELCLKLSNR